MIGIEPDDTNGNMFNNNLLGQDNSQAWPQTPQAVQSGASAGIPPVSMGGFAQANALAKGGYFDHGGKLYHQREGKVFQVTGAPEGDYELNAGQTAELNARRGQDPGFRASNVAAPGTGSEFTPRPAPSPRRQAPELWTGEADDRANPLNPPYGPESVAVSCFELSLSVHSLMLRVWFAPGVSWTST